MVPMGVTVLATALFLVVLRAALPVVGTLQCDGSVPRWMVPADYDGGGCMRLPTNWEATQPWNEEDLVCLGLCVGVEPYRP